MASSSCSIDSCVTMDTPAVLSLMSKLDYLDVWVHDTRPGVLVISETWLNNFIMDKDFAIADNNIFKCDRQISRGMAVYVRSYLMASCFLSISVPTLCELLVIKESISQNMHIFIAAVYHPQLLWRRLLILFWII